MLNKRSIFILPLVPFLMGSGPIVPHREPDIQREFQNVYDDLSRIKKKTVVSSFLANTSPASSTGNNQWYDITNITLTAGSWEISAIGFQTLNGATQSAAVIGIGTSSGNNTAGLVSGRNYFNIIVPTGALDGYGPIPSYNVSVSSQQVYYLKAQSTFSAGTPKAYGWIEAIKN